MRMLKGSGNHIRNQALKNIAKALACGLLLCLIGIFLIFRLITAPVSFLEEALAVFTLAPLVGFYYYLRQYRIYRGGWEGEKQVAKLLCAALNDEYYLINGLHVHDGHGDIDHVVLGPNGVFALETKNWSGKITVNGDTWIRQGRRHVSGSPSEQAKKNSAKIRRVIENSGTFPFNVWVEAVVVLTNDHAKLRLNDSNVPILNLKQLPTYISAHRNQNSYSARQLEQIGKEILNQTR
jgi:hypothetical protein